MNKTDKIFAELKKRLKNGIYPENSKFPSETTLADEFSVNKMTINKIVSMLVEQKYLIRGIRGAGTRVAENSSRPRGSLAFLAPLSAYTMQVLQGIYAEAVRCNFNVIIESPSVSELGHRLNLLKNSNIKGVISVTYGTPHLPDGMKLFAVDCSIPNNDPDVHIINSDNYQGGIQMMSEIIRRGHKNILLFSSERFFSDSNAPKTPRVKGFHDVMSENGIADFEERTFYSAPSSAADAKYFLETYLKRYPETTLIAADSDGSVSLLHSAALRLGIDCPGKIALTGFGNVSPLPIANVDQNPRRQGELAARYLIDYTLNGTDNAPSSVSVETSLVNIEQIPIILNN